MTYSLYLKSYLKAPWVEVTLPFVEKTVSITPDFLIQLFLTYLSITVVLKTGDRKRHSWLLNIGKKSLGIPIYFIQELYIKCTLDVILMMKSLYAWYQWDEKRKTKHKKPLEVTTLEWPIFSLYYILGIAGALMLGFVYSNCFEGVKSPYKDGFHAAMSILNYYFLARKKREAWLFSLTGQIIYIYICYTKGMLFLLKYILYAILSIRNFYAWDQAYKKTKESMNASQVTDIA